MTEADVLKIIELFILIGSFLIIASQLHAEIYMSAYSVFMQLNMFKIQEQGILTQSQLMNITSVQNDLNQYRDKHQQISNWMNFYGFILITSSLVCIWLFITFGIPKEKKYKKIARTIASILLLIFILLFFKIWIKFIEFTF